MGIAFLLEDYLRPSKRSAGGLALAGGIAVLCAATALERPAVGFAFTADAAAEAGASVSAMGVGAGAGTATAADSIAGVVATGPGEADAWTLEPDDR